MVINIFNIVRRLRLILISIGVITGKRKYQDIYYIFGGLCLLIYSLYINNLIFIILQIVFIFTAIYDLRKQKRIK